MSNEDSTMKNVFLPLLITSDVFNFLKTYRIRIQKVQKELVSESMRYKNALDPDPEGTKISYDLDPEGTKRPPI